MENYKHINLDFLRRITGGDRERLDKYIRLFLDEAPKHLGRIRLNLDKEDWPAVKKSVHTFKPQLKYMGIEELDSVINKIEYFSEAETGLDRIPKLIKQLDDVCNQAMDELKQAMS